MVGVIETAKSGISTFDSILKLQKDVEHKMQSLGNSYKHGQTILNYLFERPIMNAKKAKELTGLSLPSVYKILKMLEDQNILYETTGAKRGKLFLFKEYLRLFK